MRRSLLSPRARGLFSPSISSIARSRRAFALSSRLNAPVTAPSSTLSEAINDSTSSDASLDTSAPSVNARLSVRAARHDSPKLSALHARLSLPPRFPVSSLGRCLVHPSADRNPLHNNASLAVIGQDLIANYTAEWLLCNYPRLPMQVLFAAQHAYSGPPTLSAMREEWGVESVAAPGIEVDPGLLQFTRQKPGNAMADGSMRRLKDVPSNENNSASNRPNSQWNYRRGTSSRIIYDNNFGDLQDTADSSASASSQNPEAAVTTEEASASFINAVFGALYLHAGAQATQAFHQAHILSRHIPLHTLFSFTHPTRDLSRLCAREGFEPPVARLLSETGRHSRSPVFVVGVYSGSDKLGEAAGSSLDEARVRATAAALRSWYLYSPPRENIVLPSHSATTQWKPQMIDIGEIVT